MNENELKQAILNKYNDTNDQFVVGLKNSFEPNRDWFEKEYGLTYLNKVKENNDFDRLGFMKHFFGNKESFSLIYVIERDKRFINNGSIKGGSSAKFPLWFGSSGSWRTGKTREISEDEIKSLAPIFLQILFDILTKAKSISVKEKVTENDYFELNQLIYDKAKELNDKSNNKFNFKLYNMWIFKYLSILYPNIFSCWYNWNWISKVSNFLNIDKKDYDRLIVNGLISLKLNSFNLCIPENNVIQKIVNDLIRKESSDIDNKQEVDVSRVQLVDKSKYHNIILYGVPGTGKTYTSVYLAVKLAMNEDPKLENDDFDIGEDCEYPIEQYNALVKEGRISFITFHQSYSYEDFIGGIRPKVVENNLLFVWKNGIFKNICENASKNQNNNYCLIIDEINRGNISRIFGELITLIESSKRGETIKLPNNEDFSVPNNLFIIGTMNSSDKSISLIDVALRRRFNFFEIKINPEIVDDNYKNFYVRLNKKIKEKYQNDDLVIGHSYFMYDSDDDKTFDDSIDHLIFVLNFKIIPLLYEICSDNKNEVKEILEYSLDSVINDNDNNIKYSQCITVATGDDISNDSFSFGRITVKRN